MIARPSQIDRNDTVFVTLQHELRLASGDIPELYGSVFGPRDDPLSIRGDGD